MQLHEVAGLSGEMLHMAFRFIQDTQVYVVKGKQRTNAVTLDIGMPEGRRLSPAFYIALAAIARQCVGQAVSGLGRDPPRRR